MIQSWLDVHEIHACCETTEEIFMAYRIKGPTLKVIMCAQFVYYKNIIPCITEAQMKNCTLVLRSTNFTFTLMFIGPCIILIVE